jgi:hypothetical protein
VVADNPNTLPADFFSRQAVQPNPDTLPADFFSDSPKPSASGGGRGGRGGGGAGQQHNSDSMQFGRTDGKTGFAGRVIDNLNPVPLIDSLAHHPIETIGNILLPADAPAKEAADAFNKGRYVKGMERTVEDIPLVGPIVRQAREDYQKGDYGAMAGTAASMLAPSILKKAKVNIPIPKTLNPVEESAVNYAAREGIPVDAATATGNKAVHALQETVGKQPLMASRAAELRRAQNEGIQQGAQRLTEQVAPTASGDPVVAGQAVADTLKRRVGKLNDIADTQYDRLRQIAAEPKNTKQVQTGVAKSSLVDAQGNPITTPVIEDVKLPTAYSATKARLAPIVEQLEKSIPEAQKQASPGLSLMRQILSRPDMVDADTAMRDLSAIQNIARGAGELPEVRGVSKGLAATIVPELRRAVDDAVASGGADATKALARGRLATRSKYAANDLYDSLPKNGMGEIEPARVFKRLTQNDDASLQQLRAVQKKAPVAVPEIARAYVEGLMNDMVYQGDVRRAQSAVRAWHGLGAETKNILFPPEIQQNITDFVNYAEMVGRKSNPSGTASTAATLASILNPKLLAAQAIAGKPIVNMLFGNAGANPSIRLSLGKLPSRVVAGTVVGNTTTPDEDKIPRFAKGGIAGLHGPEKVIVGDGGEPEAIIPLSKLSDPIAEQLHELAAFKRRAVRIPKGAFPHQPPAGMATHLDPAGNRLIFNPSLIGIHDIKTAIATNRLSRILGTPRSKAQEKAIHSRKKF